MPKTIQDQILNHLTGNGMFPSQADAVLAAMKDDESLAEMRNRWAQDADDYDPSLIALIYAVANHHALECIDASMPGAWYRPNFVTEG